MASTVSTDETLTNKSIAAKAYAVHSATSPFELFDFARREPDADDVLIRIKFCGICHTDIHVTKNDWRGSKYPVIPGHEITGIVERIGQNVQKFKIGDRVGVGCMVHSCCQCKRCENNLEQHCRDTCYTYNSFELDKKTPTYGGYSNIITVKQRFVCKVPDNLSLDAAAPLLCAGITSYSPLKRFNVGKGTRLGVVGLGGLGHMAVKFGVAMGAEVSVISTSESKRENAMRMGAKRFIISSDANDMAQAKDSLDIIIDTVSAVHEAVPLINLLDLYGVFCVVGVSPKPFEIPASPLLHKKPIITGGLIGGMKETQEMLDFCGENNIVCDIELIEANPDSIAAAYDRTMKADVKYRFVLNIENAFK